MPNNNESIRMELLSTCHESPKFFRESVDCAFVALFEDDTTSGQTQGQDQTIPVNTQNVVSSDTADTIPAQLKDAQTSAKAVETEQQKLSDMQKTADEKVQNLRDTLAVASNDTQNTQGNTNGQV